ncbi:MAG: VOC family protein [Pseudomonadota bacterium]
MINATRAYPVIPVSSLDAALAHYTEAMGFAFDWRDGDGFAAISSGPVSLFLQRAPNVAGSATVIVNVEDADATYAAWRAAQVRIVDPIETRPWGMREFSATDLDGNRLTIGHVDEAKADYTRFEGPAMES